MSCGVIKQCNALTKHKCQCKNHVTGNGEFCDRHSKKEIVKEQVVKREEEPEIKPGHIIPENIYFNGKFIPNINKIQVPVFIKPKRGGCY